ncbi:unnamed protein product [Symbiodinium natans]|uniref:Uncharacterized protein n=1 Tax=Symbiodinium natans TaxID=878477 RepID=A0A812H9F7_9DINO|nr:unnamed protein product [Symbiodinium natans]
MASWTLQQLSTLQSSTVSHDKKLEACQEVSDKLNENILKGETRATALAKMSLGRPKTIGKIKQQRLASKEHLQAVLHVTSLLGLDLEPPERRLAPAEPREQVSRHMYGSDAFLFDQKTGEGWWQMPDSEVIRLVLQADQGGPLYTAYQWCAAQGYAISFIRDESDGCVDQLAHESSQEPMVHFSGGGNMEGCRETNDIMLSDDPQQNFENVISILDSLWCSWGFLAGSYGRNYTATLLVLTWCGIEEGRNPFAVWGHAKSTGDFDKVVDMCVKARVRSLDFLLKSFPTMVTHPLNRLCWTSCRTVCSTVSQTLSGPGAAWLCGWLRSCKGFRIDDCISVDFCLASVSCAAN